MLSLLQRCFPQQLASEKWQQKIKAMIPSYGQSMASDAELCDRIRTHTSRVLGLPYGKSGGVRRQA